MKIVRLTVCFLAISFSGIASAQDAQPADVKPPRLGVKKLSPAEAMAQAEAVRQLIARKLPKDAAKFVVETIPAEIETVEVLPEKPKRPPADGAPVAAPQPVVFEIPHDVFELQTQNGKVILRGNNATALASAFHYFLKYSASSQISWDGLDQITLPAQLPTVSPKVRAVSPHAIRWAYQPATHGYTTPYWNWEKWEKELDFLALSGINRALVITGQEAVWQATWKAFGYTDEDIRKWLVMPAHAPWQMTGNMENNGAPVPQSVIDARLKLGQQIVKRMRELGIEPVLPGYFGLVPSDFKKRHPNAKVIAQGNWTGELKRPDFLSPEDPLFTQIAEKYYASLKQYFGDMKMFSADPFNDKGKPGEQNLVEVGQAIYEQMDKASPGAIWTLMATVEQPIGSLIYNVEKDRLLMLDLAADRQPIWRDRKGFDGVPWVWSAMNNDGGRTGMNGNLNAIGNAATLARHNKESGMMSGIGVTPHSGQNNAAFWDLMLENTWRDAETNGAKWLERFPKRRYGAVAPTAERAWGLLRTAAYNQSQSIVPAIVSVRPYFIGPQVKPNSESYQRADIAKIYAEIWKGLIDAAPQLDKASGSEAYRHDVAQVGTHALEALAGRYQVEICKAYRLRDKESLKNTGARMIGLLRDMDELLGTRREFMLGSWIDDARKWGATADDKNLCELDAKLILTTWSLPPTQRDFARRNWSGLINTYYLPRWDAWIKALSESLDKNAKLDDKKLLDQLSAMEIAWVKQPSKFAAYPIGDTAQLAKKIYDKYSADFDQPVLMAVRTINGAWTPEVTSTDKLVWMWDVSELAKNNGEHEAEFKFGKGESGLQIYRVSLMQGNREIAFDAHAGFAGTAKRNNIYRLKASTLNPAQPVMLRAEVSGDSSSDSSGEIELRKAARRDPRIQQEIKEEE